MTDNFLRPKGQWNLSWFLSKNLQYMSREVTDCCSEYFSLVFTQFNVRAFDSSIITWCLEQIYLTQLKQFDLIMFTRYIQNGNETSTLPSFETKTSIIIHNCITICNQHCLFLASQKFSPIKFQCSISFSTVSCGWSTWRPWKRVTPVNQSIYIIS